MRRCARIWICMVSACQAWQLQSSDEPLQGSEFIKAISFVSRPTSRNQARALDEFNPLIALTTLFRTLNTAVAFDPSSVPAHSPPRLSGMGNVRAQRSETSEKRQASSRPSQRVPGAETSERTSSSRPSQRVPGEFWPEKDKGHRFIKEDDPTFEEYLINPETGYTCKTSDLFQGTRIDGVYQRSSRVQFTLPDKGDKPLTIELLQSREQDNPSFGAVKVRFPVDATVTTRESRIVVKQVRQGSAVQKAGIQSGDIIRAVSLPERDNVQEHAPWWSRIGQPQLPHPEEGMLILDGRPAADFFAALRDNEVVNGKDATVVLLIERPVQTGSNDDKGMFGGFFDDDEGLKNRFITALVKQPEPIADLVPIPIPVEADDPNFPPGFRRTTVAGPESRS